MALSSTFSHPISSHQNMHYCLQFQLERSPRMLKDFLEDDPNSSCGFVSFSRQPSGGGGRSHEAKSSAFQSMINAIQNIPFALAAASKSPPSKSILPRSLSRKLSKKSTSSSNKMEDDGEMKITVRVKDIIRWKSFRDLVDEKSPPSPLDFASSPLRCTTTTTTTTTTSTTSSTSSSRSSWCDSDFTSEYLPCGNLEDEVVGKKSLPCVGSRDGNGICMQRTTAGTEDYNGVGPDPEREGDHVLVCDSEKEQNSPLSVLDHLQFREDEDGEPPFSPNFHRSLANNEFESTKYKLMQKLKRFENLAELEPFKPERWMSMEEKNGSELKEDEEEPNYEVEVKAMQLLNYVKATSSVQSCDELVEVEDQLLLDFFRDELLTRQMLMSCRSIINNDQFEYNEIVKMAKAWISGGGEHSASLIQWGLLDHNKELCVRDMGKGGRWSKFEEEQQELCLEIETGLLGSMVNEILADLFSGYKEQH